MLQVRVRERAVDGAANAAVLAAVAEAFGLPRRSVGLVRGAASRSKLLELAGAHPSRLEELLAGLA